MNSEKKTSGEVDSKKSPDNPEFLLEIAHQHILAKQPQRGLEVLKSAFKLIPECAELAAAIGNIAISMGEIDTALYYLSIAVGINPATPACHHNLGLLHMSQGNYEKARRSFAAILEYEPENATVYNDLGVVQNCLGQNAKALESFQQALRYDPHYEKAFINCAELMFQLEQHESGYQLTCDFESANPAHKATMDNWKNKFMPKQAKSTNSSAKPTCKSFKLNAN